MAMFPSHLLHGVALPQTALAGRPSEDPISDGVLPRGVFGVLAAAAFLLFDILEPLHFAHQGVQYLRQQRDCRQKFLS